MARFIFMLTKNDSTVADCLEIYDEVRESGLAWVGFKDVGVEVAILRELTRRIRADGRHVVMEVVSTDPASELRSVSAGLDLGVDLLMGGTQAADALPILARSSIQYYPFAGRIVGHPSRLKGTVGSIAESARALTSLRGVSGLDLLAYRWAGDVSRLMTAVVQAAHAPVVVAGSIASQDRIEAATASGAWGFTIGGAIIDRALVHGGSLRDQVEWTLRAAAHAEQAYVGPALVPNRVVEG